MITDELSSSRLRRCRHSQPRKSSGAASSWRAASATSCAISAAAAAAIRRGTPGTAPAFLIDRLLGVVLGLAALVGLADGKEDGANQSQDQGYPSSDHPAHQALVPPGEFVQVVQGRRRPRQDRLVVEPVP